MRKLKSKTGLTLMEMMAALLVMVLLVVGMGTGMDAGMRVYRDAQYETDSAAMESLLNTSLTDMLRYAKDVKPSTATPENVEFVFTNLEYGVMDGYFRISDEKDSNGSGMIQVVNLRGDSPINLLSLNRSQRNGKGAFKFHVTDLHVVYVPEDAKSFTKQGEENPVQISRGGFFYITYNIVSDVDGEIARAVETVVRQMNT